MVVPVVNRPLKLQVDLVAYSGSRLPVMQAKLVESKCFSLPEVLGSLGVVLVIKFPNK